MKPFELHTKAMDFSFLAKRAREDGNEDDALKLYEKAAQHESNAADFYFDKPELEPTRSVLIRSAAFLNLKAGLANNAEKYIFWGLANTEDEFIREQLYEALEICISQRKLDQYNISKNVDYIYKLRQKSQQYVLEPESILFGSALSLDMLSDFSNNYVKSFFAYAKSKYRDSFGEFYDDEEAITKASSFFQEKVKPLITSSSFGSFRFSIATDFLSQSGEDKKIVALKSKILLDYHEEIFIKDLTDKNISLFKEAYSDEEIDSIFRPLLNIKSSKSNYRVSYYDREDLRKHRVSSTNIYQKKKLLPIKSINEEEVGFLVNQLTHKKSSKKDVLYKQILTTASFVIPIKTIKAKGISEILLNEEVIVNVKFDSDAGFTFNFEEFNIEVKSNDYSEGLNSLHLLFLNKIKELTSKESNLSASDSEEWQMVKMLINDPFSIK